MSTPAPVKASDTALLPALFQQQQLVSPNPAVGSAAQTALSALSAPSPQPFAMVSGSDALRRAVGLPAFTPEQAEYVDALLRRHAVAAADVPFVHLLHLAVFQHTDVLKRRLNELALQHGTLESFSKKFMLANPYSHTSFAFLQLYNSHRDRAALMETGLQVFDKRYLGMKLQVELILKCYAGMINDLEGKAPARVIRELKGELESLRHAWGATLAFADAVGQRPSESLYLRAQLQLLKRPPTQQHYVSALQQLVSEGAQGMLGDYLAFVESALPISELGLYRTLDLSSMTKKKGAENIIHLQGIIFIQGAVLDEIELVLDRLRNGSPQELDQIRRVLDCEDMSVGEIATAFQKALALQESVRLLNAAFGSVAARIGAFDPQYSAKVERSLDDLAVELGIQRRESRSSEEEAVLAFLDRLPPPPPLLQAATVHPTVLPPPALPQSDQAPSQPATPRVETQPPAPPVPSLTPAPVLPEDELAPPQPSTPPRPARRAGASAARLEEPQEDRKEMGPSVVSPPRIRRGMNLRKVLNELKRKGIQIVRQRGSHMQMTTGQTVAVHPGATIGARAAKALSKKDKD